MSLKVIETARALLDAFGGDVPAWLRDEAQALEVAIAEHEACDPLWRAADCVRQAHELLGRDKRLSEDTRALLNQLRHRLAAYGDHARTAKA